MVQVSAYILWLLWTHSLYSKQMSYPSCLCLFCHFCWPGFDISPLQVAFGHLSAFPDSLPVFTYEIHVAVSQRRQLIIFMACESNLIKSVFLLISSDSETVKLPYEVSQVHYE